ncbi:hypothetical protein [Streptomyces malaysiensis]|uniref:hypothetical protein n=1 Tax=Streptomyces sp. HNM0561 TaxID=2903099 RepID=UPI003FA6EDA4
MATQLHVKTNWLNVSHAFHSPLMQPILAPFTTTLNTLTHHPPHTPLISMLTAAPTHPDTTHWTHHITAPVRYTDTLHHLHHHGITTYLEIGPDTTLTALARTTLPHHPPHPHHPPQPQRGRDRAHRRRARPHQRCGARLVRGGPPGPARGAADLRVPARTVLAA